MLLEMILCIFPVLLPKQWSEILNQWAIKYLKVLSLPKRQVRRMRQFSNWLGFLMALSLVVAMLDLLGFHPKVWAADVWDAWKLGVIGHHLFGGCILGYYSALLLSAVTTFVLKWHCSVYIYVMLFVCFSDTPWTDW